MDNSLVVGLGITMILVGAGFLYFLLRNNEGYRPRDVVETISAALSVLLIVSAAGLLMLASTTAERVEATVQEQISAMQDIKMEVEAGSFEFTGLDDGAVRTLEDYRGKVVVLNFWATWCIPCLTEIPDLNRLYGEFKDDGLVVISVSDEEPDHLREFEEMLPMDTESMLVPLGTELPAPFTGAMLVRPTTFIIDRDGIVHRYLLGPRTLEFFQETVGEML